MAKRVGRDGKDQQPCRLFRRPVEHGTAGQARYHKLLRSCDITIVNGLAGTGKTFMAVGNGMHLLDDQQSPIKKIVVTRPMVAVEGEELGILPGELEQKVAPWVMPVFDSIRKFCRDDGEYRRLIDPQNGIVQICPLAVMRGMTFDDSYVILDEAQNTTPKQMEMFLTRMGKNCRVVITGDVTQSDLDEIDYNGLEWCLLKLAGRTFRKGKVGVCKLGAADIMRNDLIAELLVALHEEERDDDQDDDRDGGDRGDPNPYDQGSGKNNGFYPHNRLNGFGPSNGVH